MARYGSPMTRRSGEALIRFELPPESGYSSIATDIAVQLVEKK